MRINRIITALLIAAGLNALAATMASHPFHTHPTSLAEAPADTTSGKRPKYSVRRTDKERTEDLKKKTADLRDPDNVQTEVSYDDKTDTYTMVLP